MNDEKSVNRLPSAWGTPEPAASGLLITCGPDCPGSSRVLDHLNPAGLVVLPSPANLIPPWVGGSSALEAQIEHAVTVRRAREVVVCGHRDCRQLDRLFDPQTALFDLTLATWLVHAEAVLLGLQDVPAEQRRRLAPERNAHQQSVHLRTHPAVGAALASGGLRLHVWVYDPDLDEVFSADRVTGRFTCRARLDPLQNRLFRRERILRKTPGCPGPSIAPRYLA